MTEQRTKLSYEKGLLICSLEKLQLELERMPTILSELQQSKKNALEIDARNKKVLGRFIYLLVVGVCFLILSPDINQSMA